VNVTCVLVVDDEATLLKNVARSLRAGGFEVITAPDCADARKALSRGHVDALCLDINLPDGDGLELLEEIRRTAPDLPTIVISGAATAENRSRAARLGVHEFLRKPFRLADLKVALGKFFDATGDKENPVG
jgi:DNA-binding NtrC family response regulator